MKIVELKTLTCAGEEPFVYQKHMVDIISMPANPDAGLNYDEMCTIQPIREKLLNASGDKVHLEDAEHAELVKRMKSVRLGVYNERFVAMINDTINAKEAPQAK
jgi:hypothetical protein